MLCTPHNDSLISASQALPALSQLMGRHRALWQGCDHSERLSALRGQCFCSFPVLLYSQEGKSAKCEKWCFWRHSVLIWEVHALSNTLCWVCWLKWYTVPIGLCFYRFNNKLALHTSTILLVALVDSLALTPNIWSLQKGLPYTNPWKGCRIHSDL